MTSSIGGPIGGQTRISLTNDHAQYMFTWWAVSAITTILWLQKFVLWVVLTFPIIFPLWSKSGFIVISPKKKYFQSCILWALVVNSEQFGVPRDVDHPGMWGHQRLCGLVPASKTIPQTNCQARLLHRINNAIVILSIPLQYVVVINSFLGSMFRFSFLN